MSTTFGVRIKNHTHKIAFRYYSSTRNKEIVRFKNPVYELLPDDTEVVPMDNTAQGIETVGDLKKINYD